MASYVYVISGDHGRQKIGVSDDPKRRIAELATGSPYPLKFEFVGEVQDGGAGQVEVEAHFMLAQHRALGEWFVVPPDVAVTAVMAAAHRLGYRIKPVDPDAMTSQTIQVGTPDWHHWMTAIASVPFLGGVWWIISSFDTGQIGAVAMFVSVAVLFGAFHLLRRSLIQAGDTVRWIKGPSV